MGLHLRGRYGDCEMKSKKWKRRRHRKYCRQHQAFYVWLKMYDADGYKKGGLFRVRKKLWEPLLKRCLKDYWREKLLIDPYVYDIDREAKNAERIFKYVGLL